MRRLHQDVGEAQEVGEEGCAAVGVEAEGEGEAFGGEGVVESVRLSVGCKGSLGREESTSWARQSAGQI